MKKIVVVIFLGLILTNHLFSQQIKTVRDFGIWGGINIKKDLSKDIEINLEQQVRYYSNFTKFDDYIADFGFKYKMNKNFKLGVNLRYTYNEKRWRDAENNYRYNLDLNYKAKIYNKVKLYYRLRYQQEYVDLFRDFQTTNIKYSVIRNKVKFQYSINKKNKLFISAELYRLIESFKEPYFNLTRFQVGNDFNTKIGVFNCSLGYAQEINTTHPLSFYFVKTIYTLKL